MWEFSSPAFLVSVSILELQEQQPSQPALEALLPLSRAHLPWHEPTTASFWNQPRDSLVCYLGLAITLSWQGEMLSRC